MSVTKRRMTVPLGLAVLCVAAQMAVAAAPVPVAVAPFDYMDTSGEPRDQKAPHAARLAEFEHILRDELVASGRFRLAEPAQARLLVTGGVHKMSTLVEWVQVDTVDAATGKRLSSRTLTFRGDSDNAWTHAAHYVGRMIAE